MLSLFTTSFGGETGGGAHIIIVSPKFSYIKQTTSIFCWKKITILVTLYLRHGQTKLGNIHTNLINYSRGSTIPCSCFSETMSSSIGCGIDLTWIVSSASIWKTTNIHQCQQRTKTLDKHVTINNSQRMGSCFQNLNAKHCMQRHPCQQERQMDPWGLPRIQNNHWHLWQEDLETGDGEIHLQLMYHGLTRFLKFLRKLIHRLGQQSPYL